MKIYLDSNIFIYLENKSLTIADLEDLIKSKITKILFSATHISEALEIEGNTAIERKNRIIKRLNLIENITQNHYINESIGNEVYEIIESPFEVFKTITDVPFAQNSMKSLINLIGEDQRVEIRKVLNLDPKRINNYKPDEVIEHLNYKLSETGQDFTFLSLIELGISYHKDAKTFGRSNRFAAIFELLDMFGYWKDTATSKSNYARFSDSSHAFFASYCDYFITDDKRTRNKTEVVYKIYDIKTKVISSKSKNQG
ncbi:MAG: hypothetical protein KDC56_02405 [Flavobacteriaceae bacterium]|nr:hypothetical protein [Flavobacteriaceae bacterium]